MSEHRSMLERELERLTPPRITFDQLERRRDHRRRDQRIRAAVVGLAVAIGVGLLGANLIRSTPSVPSAETPTPTPTPTPPPEEGPPPARTTSVRIDWERVPTVSIDGDAIVDIQTGEVTALPPGIASFRKPGGYAVAPGGEVLLFEASAAGSSDNQIYVADVDGSNVRQLTDAPGGADAGGWSPDGTTIVARVWGPEGPGRDGGEVDLVLVDVATGETTLLASGPDHNFFQPHFSADGQRILFSRYTKPEGSDLFGIPVDGGDAALVFEERWNATFSPDGRTIVYEASYFLRTSNFNSGWTGQELWLADADGSDPRRLFREDSYNRGAGWSPDGTRIVYVRYHIDEPYRVAVVDVAGGTPTFSVLMPDSLRGQGAVWLDDDTLLVDV